MQYEVNNQYFDLDDVDIKLLKEFDRLTKLKAFKRFLNIHLGVLATLTKRKQDKVMVMMRSLCSKGLLSQDMGLVSTSKITELGTAFLNKLEEEAKLTTTTTKK